MDNLISYDAAKEMIMRYRENYGNVEVPEFKNALPLSETFNVSAFRKLIDQPGCVKVRAYYAMKANKQVCIVIVAVNEQDQDMVGLLRGGETDIIIEDSLICPPDCSPSSGF